MIKIKVPVKDIEKDDICSKIEERLKQDKENAYTIAGLMIEVLKIKPADIENKPFKDWKKGLPSKYTSIRLCLQRLKKEEKVNVKKHGKAWIYWWSKED